MVAVQTDNQPESAMQRDATKKQAKTGDQIKAGDSLYNFIDGAYVGDVMSVHPYTGPLLDLVGAGSQIGSFYGGMEMTLPAVSSWLVATPD